MLVFACPFQARRVDNRKLSKAFALVLRKHRLAKGLSQERLAELAGIHPTYVGLVERSLRNPTLNVAQSLADALGTPLSHLIAEAESGQLASKRRERN